MELDKYPIAHPVGDWMRERLPEGWAFAANTVIAMVSIVTFGALAAMLLVWLERKVCARMQARLGPTRVGPFGLLQPVADVLKLLFKERILPRLADGFVYRLAPFLPITAAFLLLAVIPFDSNLQAADPQAGVLFVLGVSGLGTLGVLMAGWGSHNKYSLLGSMRTGAQMFSYELSLMMGILVVVLASGSSSLRDIVLSQQGSVLDWWLFKLPVAGFIAFLSFVISSTAELGRGPLDLSEAESELTGGFHTEYGGMTFALFFMAEFLNLASMSALACTFFLGGFLAPQFGWAPLDGALAAIPGFFWFTAKSSAVILLYMWLRWSFPRPRIDQLLAFEWKFLLPATLANLLLAAGLTSMGWTL